MDLFRARRAAACAAAALLFAGCGGGSHALVPAGAPVDTQAANGALTASAGMRLPAGVHVLRVPGLNRFRSQRRVNATQASYVNVMVVSVPLAQIRFTGFAIANYAQTYGISTILVFMDESEFSFFVNNDQAMTANINAMAAVADLYMYSGDATWLKNPNVVPHDANVLTQQIAPKWPQFKGIIYHIPPQDYSTWNSDRKGTIKRYFTLLNTLFSGGTSYSFGNTGLTTEGLYATQVNSNGGTSPSMLQEIESYPAVSGTLMFAPGASASAQMSASAPAFAQMQKPYWILSSTDQIPAVPTYYNTSQSYFVSQMQQLSQLAPAQNGNYAGVANETWDDVANSMQTVLLQPPAPITPNSAPLLPPPGQIYFGAYVPPNPNLPPNGTVAAFESQISRKLAFNEHFRNFFGQFPGLEEQDDFNNGRASIVTWLCGETNASIAAGQWDKLITTRANEMRIFGHPIFLRYMREFNLPYATKNKCSDPAHDVNNFYSPTEFIAAWQHIHQIFTHVHANNVIWMWNASAGGANSLPYYPGDQYVDWIGYDHYDVKNASFLATYDFMYQFSSLFNKPIFIGETGAKQGWQSSSAFFPQGVASLQNQFPSIKAYVYYNAQGNQGNWTLDSAGTAAASTFSNLPYMSAFPQL